MPLRSLLMSFGSLLIFLAKPASGPPYANVSFSLSNASSIAGKSISSCMTLWARFAIYYCRSVFLLSLLLMLCNSWAFFINALEEFSSSFSESWDLSIIAYLGNSRSCWLLLLFNSLFKLPFTEFLINSGFFFSVCDFWLASSNPLGILFVLLIAGDG